MSIVAFDGTIVVLSEERWRHIILRHPELEKAKSLILDAVAAPDEAYEDATGAVHAKRKARRYKTFRNLKPS